MIFGTDVTQFKIGEDKLYLSPIIDFHTREIVAYDISARPNMKQIYRMMEMFEDRYGIDFMERLFILIKAGNINKSGFKIGFKAITCDSRCRGKGIA